MLAGLSPARRRLVLALLALVVVAAVVVTAAVVVPRLSGGAGSATEAAQDDTPGPVLLVPGYGGSTASLRPLAERLTAAGRDATVVPVPGDGTGDLTASAEALYRCRPTAKVCQGGSSRVNAILCGSKPSHS